MKTAGRGRGRGAGIAGVALVAGVLAACARPQPLPDLGSAPQFQLTDQTGEVFDSRSLAGHVWVADFIYTTCPGPCPMMTHHMRSLETKTSDLPAVRFVSFTVDPAHDTPAVLAAYAKRFAADVTRWSFLTGSEAELNRLGLDAFHLNPVDGKLDHSTRFALVDGQGRIRGYYSIGDDGFMTKLVRDIHRLESET